MRFRVFASMAMAALVAMCTTTADAGYFTTNASFFAMDPGPTSNPGANPPVIHIQSMSMGTGQLWTNQVNGAPFAAGSTVRTVGAAAVGSMINGTVSPVVLPDGTPFHSIFAVEGTIIAPGVANFHTGSVWFASQDTGNPVATGFEAEKPETWNFANSFTKFDLAPPAEIQDGSVLGFEPSHSENIAAVAVNKSSVDLFGEVGSGVFVFEEDGAFTPGAGFVNPGLGTFVGDDWMFDVEGGGAGRFEGLAAITQQTVDNPPVGLTAAGLAMLDTIGLAAFGGLFTAGGFTPTGDGAGTGDFSASLSLHADPIAVPEPASIAIFTLGLFGMGGARLSRNRRKNVTPSSRS